jgi:putative protease
MNPANVPLFSAPSRPELLAPAGDAECARAAVENGADAVYFGLRMGLNARARAINFSPEELSELMAYLHLRGVKGYVTFNTLVFPDEWEQFEAAVRLAVATGVDAALVQDLGAARLIRALCADWPLHASTQMSLTSAEGIRVAESLGISRVVLARELSLDEIAQIRRETRVELEVFCHGALCISFSGQCLASLSMGGRSGNRGQCAQPCRLPYEVLGDKGRRDFQSVQNAETDGLKIRSTTTYPLSPNDLAALDLVPELIAAGVDALKIEGRLKSAQYVAAVTRQYRRAIDEALAGRRLQLTSQEIEELEVSFSRGFSHGWLKGRDRGLVPGHGSAKRGMLVGTVRAVRNGRVTVELTGEIKRGDGVVFEGDRSRESEQGGRVYDVRHIHPHPNPLPKGEGTVELAFGRDAIDVSQLSPGQKVWKTDDPQVMRRLRKTYTSARPQRRVWLDLAIEAAVGRPLAVSARAGSGASCQLATQEALQEAKKYSLTAEVLREQFGRLGGTVYGLRGLEVRIEGRPMIPLSVLGGLRHEMVEKLNAAATRPQRRTLRAESPLSPLRSHAESRNERREAVWHVLCRSLEQLKWVLATGARSVMVELGDLAQYPEAVRLTHDSGAELMLATPRIQKPGEMEMLRKFIECRPHGILARNLASAAFCAEHKMPFVADFSLNAVNELSVGYLHDLGAQRITAAYDLGREQLLDLASRVPPEWLEVIVYGHVPMFHTEHCLQVGKNPESRLEACSTNLRDRRGVTHPVRTGICGRTTVYHGEPRDLSELAPTLIARGVRHFRIELLDGMTRGEIEQACRRTDF